MSEIAAFQAADNAAVMMMLLDEEQTCRILSELEPDELRLLGEKMCRLGEISPDTIVEALTNFLEKTEELGLPSHKRVDQVRTMMHRALGEVKTENLMQRIVPPDAPRDSMVELARWLNASALIPLVKGEHPQAIAVLLVQLDPLVAAEVLHGLPPEQHSEIIHRVATIGPVSPQAIAMLEELLSRRITECHGARPLQMGGMKEAAEIINGVGKVIEKRVMGEIAKKDKILAKKLEEEMFKFEHLFVLEPQQMGVLLRDVGNDTLIDSLKGISEEEREFFFRAMSSRAADGVKDEIAARGRTKLSDVVAAQKEVVAIARKLVADGSLIMGAGDGEYV
ncbi:flagellar motor switch protein FliG [Novosphingobium sp. 1949]|uniref:Flagellar motor switch protein FliG n=1 Tax=Novosphingobium organovorum TaxID=2930092 RepID=A0ABT0BIF9_9SPHN|nr:FliG C-terminal domain-containing protein [Novosphingobium organovorum]MCJ2184832.1 flagellar motor switch protein FliG [Novosphingobium organovorum]